MGNCRITRYVLTVLIFLLSSKIWGVSALGINYGQVANNLPSPDKAVSLVKTIGATKVKLYDADPKVLKAFAKTGIEMMVTLGNQALVDIANDSKLGFDWVKKNVQSYLPETNITCILIGNEVLTYNDSALTAALLPSMQNVHVALQKLGLDRQVWVTTAHNFAILENSYPPSAGSFRSDLGPCIDQILNFHAKTGSPFLINAYPYFAYKADPKQVSLDYVLFQGGKGQGQVDPHSGLRYDNMLFAQVDAVYTAMGPNYSKRVQVQVSETGWPSKGDDDEDGATPDNAKRYNGNLIKLALASSQGRSGTPLKPNCDLNIFVFALFNENLKPGPTSERNYGLFKPDVSASYPLALAQTQSSGGGGASFNVTSPAPLTSSSSPPGSSSTSSTGYLSISSANPKEKYYASVGFSILFATLLIVWNI